MKLTKLEKSWILYDVGIYIRPSKHIHNSYSLCLFKSFCQMYKYHIFTSNKIFSVAW